MRIQILSHSREKYKSSPDPVYSYDILAYHFRKNGHVVDHIGRKEWSSVISRYKRFNPDLFISSGPIGGLAAFLASVKIIRCMHIHHWIDNYVETTGEKWGDLLMKSIESYTVKRANHTITPSLYRYNKGKKKELNISFLPHGTDLSLFRASSKKVKFPGTTAIKAVYTGSIIRSKKVTSIFDAVSCIPIDLILIGKVQQKLHKVPKNIHILGPKPHKETARYINHADLLLVTDNNDSSLKLMEYAASGKPFIAPKGRIEKLSKRLGIHINYFNNNTIKDALDSAIEENQKFSANKKKVKGWSETSQLFLKKVRQTKNA